ncbi:Tetratricopeptide-like helical domain superfamily [Sesbania bispinosa]|nr:Tetratricopeptide-like helical domain superfamily [Sesbania bispinosa]
MLATPFSSSFFIWQPRFNFYTNPIFRSLSYQLSSSPVPFNGKFSGVRLHSALSPAAEIESPSGGRSGALSPSPSVAVDIQKIDVNPPKGTRDFLPEDMRWHNWLFNNFKEVSRLYGFEEVDFPVLELEALFTRKAGEEIKDQLYCFEDWGYRRVALRPELSPSLARLVIQKGKSVSLPLKWFTVGQCWRYERGPAHAQRRRILRTGCCYSICDGHVTDGVAKHMNLAFFTTLCSSSDAGSPEDMGSIRRAEVWFVKIACTIFVHSNSLDCFLGYFSKHLTPSLVSEVVHRLTIPTLGFKFVEFTRDKLHIMNHSYWTYNMLLRSLCQSNLHSSAKLVYDWMRCDGQFPHNWLLGFLVSSYALAGSFDISKELLADVQCNNVGVNAVVYNDLFNILIKQNKVGDAVVLYRELIRLHYRPVTYTINILIRGLCRAGDINEAFNLLGDIKSFGCSPDIVTYNTLIHGLCRINEIGRARCLLNEICSKGELAPDVVSYTTIIAGYCKLSKMKEGALFFDEMIRSGTEPNTFTFNALIDGFGKLGDMASAVAMYEKMLLHGCPPDVATFTSLINGYFGVGQVNHALEMWHEMNERNISASLHTFSVLVCGLCKNNRLHEARDILRLLKQSDIVPQPFVYNPVIDGYCKSGNVDEANKIIAEMEEKRCKPDKMTYTILIIGHCMKGRMSEAIGIFDKMLAVGCSPDEITVNNLRSSLLMAGMSGEAARVKEALCQNLTLDASSKKRSYHESTNADIPVAVY